MRQSVLIENSSPPHLVPTNTRDTALITLSNITVYRILVLINEPNSPTTFLAYRAKRREEKRSEDEKKEEDRECVL